MTEPMEIEEINVPEPEHAPPPVQEQVYFGAKWDSPQFDDATKVPTPVGGVCGFCAELIDEDDAGTFQQWANIATNEPVRRPVHLECMLRSALGSPAHCRGECSCSGNDEPEDSRSWREQGAEVVRMVLNREGIFGHQDETKNDDSNKEQE